MTNPTDAGAALWRTYLRRATVEHARRVLDEARTVDVGRTDRRELIRLVARLDAAVAGLLAVLDAEEGAR